jgi:hypothetical protein
MKKSTKFWCSGLVIFLLIFYKLLILILGIMLIIYVAFGFSGVLLHYIDGDKFNKSDELCLKYNIIYFIFYDCIIKFNNWLDK